MNFVEHRLVLVTMPLYDTGYPYDKVKSDMCEKSRLRKAYL